MIALFAAAALMQADATPASAVPAVTGCIAADAAGQLADPAAAQLQMVDGTKLTKPSDFKKLRNRRDKANAPVIVSGGNFAGWTLKKLNLTNICFSGADFSKANFAGLRANGLGFIGSNLAGASLAGAVMQNTLLRDSDLSDVDARGVILDSSLITGGWRGSLARANFDGARLPYLRFVCGTGENDGCPFDRAAMSFKGADLRGADLAPFAFWDASFENAQLGSAKVAPGQLALFENIVLDAPLQLALGEQTVAIPAEEIAAVRNGLSLRAGPDTAPWCLPQDSECPVVERDVIALHQDVARLTASQDRQSASRAEAAFSRSRDACLALGAGARGNCLVRIYWQRREALLMQSPAALLGGSSIAVFAASDVYVTPGFATTPLYAELATKLAGGSPAVMIIRSTRAGRGDVRLRSDGNCVFRAEGLSYRPASGRMSQLSQGRWRGLFSLSDQLVAWGSADGDGSAQNSCPKAPLLLRRLAISDAAANALWDQIGAVSAVATQ